MQNDNFPHQTVRLVGYTMPVLDEIDEDPEAMIAYAARVSSNNQENPEYDKLLNYMKRNKHWSPFEMANATLEIITTRDIARQILRHRSFSFQEFSQRYQVIPEMTIREARRQDMKNRQNSIDDMSIDDCVWWHDAQQQLSDTVTKLYQEALNRGIAKEQARVVLPEGLTMSKMYMNGTIRSWMHYCSLRKSNGTQLEHQDIANKCFNALVDIFPISMENNDE